MSTEDTTTALGVLITALLTVVLTVGQAVLLVLWDLIQVVAFQNIRSIMAVDLLVTMALAVLDTKGRLESCGPGMKDSFLLPRLVTTGMVGLVGTGVTTANGTI